MTDLIVVGDEAYTEAEWRQRERKRAYNREYAKRPEVRERRRAYFREYARLRRLGVPYESYTDARLDERIATTTARLERLLAERDRRRMRRAA